jgi:hypothetical protein
LVGWEKGTFFFFVCVTLSDPIFVFGLGFDSICFRSCFVSPMLFYWVMFVFDLGSLLLSVFDCGCCLVLGESSGFLWPSVFCCWMFCFCIANLLDWILRLWNWVIVTCLVFLGLVSCFQFLLVLLLVMVFVIGFFSLLINVWVCLSRKFWILMLCYVVWFDE